MTNRPLFSIIILSKDRPQLLKKCLDSIYKNCSLNESEIILLNNSNTKQDNNLKNIKIINTHQVSKGQARNIGIKTSKGKYLYFLDDDIEIPQDNLQILKAKFKTGAAIMGGPNLTPPESSLFAKSSGEALRSPFGSGPMFARYEKLKENRHADQKSLILCNLAIEKELLMKHKLFFDKEILCNEENLLIWQLAKLTDKVFYTPKLSVYHHRRNNLTSLFLQAATYGVGRFQQTIKAPTSLVLATLAGPLFLLYLFFLIPLSYMSPIHLIPLIAYISLNAAFSMSIALKNQNLGMFPILLLIFPAIHIGYGFGFLFGAFKKS